MTVHVRRWRVEDAPELSRAVAESLDHLRPWVEWVVREPLTLAERRRWIADGLVDAQSARYAIFAAGELAGGCGLYSRIGRGGVEIGYWLHPRFTGRGVATAAVRVLCAIAFRDPSIDRVEIHHDAANIASEGVPRRAGFTHVEDRPEPPRAPGDSGVERVWRLRRPSGPA
ncbi:MAG: GNAT family N-acetyltransferase [Solirubrobacteraceae bacterium]